MYGQHLYQPTPAPSGNHMVFILADLGRSHMEPIWLPFAWIHIKATWKPYGKHPCRPTSAPSENHVVPTCGPMKIPSGNHITPISAGPQRYHLEPKQSGYVRVHMDTICGPHGFHFLWPIWNPSVSRGLCHMDSTWVTHLGPTCHKWAAHLDYVQCPRGLAGWVRLGYVQVLTYGWYFRWSAFIKSPHVSSRCLSLHMNSSKYDVNKLGSRFTLFERK